MDAEQIAAGRARWQERYDSAPQGRARLHDAVRRRGRAGVRPDRSRRPDGAHRLAGGVPVHPRHPRDRLPRQAVDDPPVRRLRQRQADQRALQDDPGRGRRRAVRRLRHADADGPRLRRPARARRGRALRRGHRLGGRHGDAVRRHRPRRDHHVDDDLRSGGPGVLHVRRRRRAAGRRHRPSSTARCRPTSSRSTSRRRSGSIRPSRT